MHDEIDRLLKEKLGDGAKALRLPDGCAMRLVGSVRQRRRRTRMRWTLACVLLVTGLFALCGLFRSSERVTNAPAMLVANDNTKPAQEVNSGWAVLGIFSECFRRGKTGKRKDEEE